MPYLNRFIQPDTIIPDPSNPQAYNRYSYVYGNPLRYIDPTGHVACSLVAEEDCSFENKSWEEMYGITINKGFKQHERLAILKAVSAVGSAFEQTMEGVAGDLFQQVYGQVKFERCSNCTGFGLAASNGPENHTIYLRQVYTSLESSVRLVVHELGHAFNNVFGGRPTSDLPLTLLREITITGYQEVGGINYPVFGIGHGDSSNDYYGYAGGKNNWQFGFTSAYPPNEEFADMFVGWTYNTWGRRVDNTSSLAYQRMQHMATFMPGYLLGR